MNFNQAQLEAINHKTGPMLILAGPGSGKTAVITERTKVLVDAGVNPRKILVVTFTKAAATEMRERFQGKMKGAYAPVQFGTFHAIFFSILKHAYNYSAANIIPQEHKRQFFKEIINKYQLETEDENEMMSNLESEISLVKGERMSLEHYYSKNCAADVFRRIYQDYDTMLRRKRWIDFDDMLVFTYDLLSQREDILAMWQSQFEYILIDEFQDINKVQYDMVKLLAKKHQNLFVVGDDDQSIYRFRGAKPEIMLNFEKDYPNAKKILLDVNYRCSKAIVDAASLVIGKNEVRFSKNIKAFREQGKPVNIVEFPDLRSENKRVVEEICRYKEQGIPYEEMAVLFRTNTQPRALLELFMHYNIPFRMKDNIPNIYDHFIAQDMINYMRIAWGNRERKLFLKLCNRPNRYISRDAFEYPEVAFESLYNFYQDKHWMIERIEQWESDLKWIKKLSPYAAINYIRKGIGYNEFLEEYAEYRRIDEDELFDILDELQENAKPFETFEEWMEHIRNYKEELEKQRQQQMEIKSAVTMETMHSSKGLEYKVVFIIDANEEITPHHKAVIPADVEEERRMFYVAMTRAKDFLHIYYSRERYNKKLVRSRFVEEIMRGQVNKR